nr:hypothetical protein CFP56_27247 [Quercus suber]
MCALVPTYLDTVAESKSQQRGRSRTRCCMTMASQYDTMCRCESKGNHDNWPTSMPSGGNYTAATRVKIALAVDEERNNLISAGFQLQECIPTIDKLSSVLKHLCHVVSCQNS